MTSDTSMDPRLERRIAEKKTALDLQRPLPTPIVAKLYEDLRVRLTYHSNAIEGNTAVGNDCNGGEVMRRLRYVSQVDGFGRVKR